MSSQLPARPDDVKSFSIGYRVRTGDVDQQMRVRLDSFARYLQDIANDNIEATEFHSTDPYWIVRRTVIQVVTPISWPANVHLERWVGAISTRWADMRVSVLADHEVNQFNPEPRPAGEVQTSAFWININEQGMPSRLTDAAFDLLSENVADTRLRWKSMHESGLPEVELPDREHRLRATDYDPFKHLNNAAYWEAVEDELAGYDGGAGSLDLVEGKFTAVIEYLRAITPRPAVRVRRQRVGDELRMWFILDEPDTDPVVAATVTVTKN